MKVVLYTQDMEPITVFDLPMRALELGGALRYVDVAVVEEISLSPPGRVAAMHEPTMHKVTLEFHKLRMPGGVESWIVTTRDEALALRLRPSWLPGQRGAINQYEQRIRTLSEGLLAALSGPSRGER
ncbi:hypothetical protein LJR074_001953 [Acidovorax sp. LjRoot74]|uniref:hypothetical protein n=1 Tax=Acidovorax sp. LjRoot74 TaxID=3342337 RepID=UPI003ECFE4CB